MSKQSLENRSKTSKKSENSDVFFCDQCENTPSYGYEGLKNKKIKYDDWNLFFKSFAFRRALIRLCDLPETFRFSYFKIVNFVQHPYKRFIRKEGFYRQYERMVKTPHLAYAHASTSIHMYMHASAHALITMQPCLQNGT